MRCGNTQFKSAKSRLRSSVKNAYWRQRLLSIRYIRLSSLCLSTAQKASKPIKIQLLMRLGAKIKRRKRSQPKVQIAQHAPEINLKIVAVMICIGIQLNFPCQGTKVAHYFAQRVQSDHSCSSASWTCKASRTNWSSTNSRRSLCMNRSGEPVIVCQASTWLSRRFQQITTSEKVPDSM